MNRPEKKNAINERMVDEMKLALRKAGGEDTARCIVIFGEGNNFTSGMDIGEEKCNKSAKDRFVGHDPIDDLFRTLRECRIPTIASVDGYALGAGLGIVASCHVAIASDIAVFGLPEIDLGLYPLGVVPLLLPLMGAKRALELGLTGDALGPKEARNYGLINYVVPEKDLKSETARIANKISNKDVIAVKAGIESYIHMTDKAYYEQYKCLRWLLFPLYENEAYKNNIMRFVDKRDSKRVTE